MQNHSRTGHDFSLSGGWRELGRRQVDLTPNNKNVFL